MSAFTECEKIDIQDLQDTEDAMPSLDYVKPDTKHALTGKNTSAFDACFTSELHALSEDIKVTHALNGKVLFIDHALSERECKGLCNAIDLCPELSFWSEKGRDNDQARAFRDADTIEVQSSAICDAIWARVEQVLSSPAKHILVAEEEDDETNPYWERELPGEWIPTGFNRDLLFAKYPSGGAFAPHTDGRAIEDFNTRSFMSVIIFLNDIGTGDGDDGGGTKFYSHEALQALEKTASATTTATRWSAKEEHLTLHVKPAMGRILVFDQSLVHEGVPPQAPYVKYIIRSDVMYCRKNPVLGTQADREAYRMFRQAEIMAEAGDVSGSISLFKQAMRTSLPMAQMMGLA